MTDRRARITLMVGAAMAVAACGGGGGGSPGALPFVPAPTPTPTPTCPPDCVATIFPDITTTTEFAAVGYDRSGDSWTSDGFSVRYDAAANAYIFDLPSTDPGRFVADNSWSDSWPGKLIDGSGKVQAEYFTVAKPAALGLTYTSYARKWVYPFHTAFLAFGLPTPQSAVPVSGSASYSAKIEGAGGGYSVGGTAAFLFDFGTGSLSGHFDLIGNDPAGWGPYSLGKYDFVNTVYSTGSTSFSGQLSNPNVNQLGSFSGLFTGPNAQELMGRWHIPFKGPWDDPGTINQGYGIFVGKKGS